MAEIDIIKFYKIVREELLRVRGVASKIQSLNYDYQKALDQEISQYSSAKTKKNFDPGLLYMLWRSAYPRAIGEPYPWEILHRRIYEAVLFLISEYERVLKAYYSDELLSFAKKSNELQARCNNLHTVFQLEYIQNRLPPSPIEEFEDSMKELKNLVNGKIIVIDRLLQQTEQMPQPSKRAFVAKGFDESEEPINKFFEDILIGLSIPFETAERYGNAAIPSKVKRRIDQNDVLIAIVQCRYRGPNEQKGAGPAWLIRELTYADEQKKEIILVSEKGVDLAGYMMEKDIVYFEKKQPHSATKRFLEALQEHGLVK